MKFSTAILLIAASATASLAAPVGPLDGLTEIPGAGSLNLDKATGSPGGLSGNDLSAGSLPTDELTGDFLKTDLSKGGLTGDTLAPGDLKIDELTGGNGLATGGLPTDKLTGKKGLRVRRKANPQGPLDNLGSATNILGGGLGGGLVPGGLGRRHHAKGTAPVVDVPKTGDLTTTPPVDGLPKTEDLLVKTPLEGVPPVGSTPPVDGTVVEDPTKLPLGNLKGVKNLNVENVLPGVIPTKRDITELLNGFSGLSGAAGSSPLAGQKKGGLGGLGDVVPTGTLPV
ncbi:hypothetical protein ABW20_dc0106769 [Dactylellina cionopaga]|nr:hypothetical protein ABW20_dc0106769 [Dactylellina cionopaga]